MHHSHPILRDLRDESRAKTTTIASTVMITGASGLLGHALTACFEAGGYRVVRQSRSPADSIRRDSDLVFPLETFELIDSAVGQARPDWIIHTAGNTNVDDCERNLDAARRLHVDASAELARAARRHQCRLLYVSTDSVYDGDSRTPHREGDHPKPLNGYARTKWEGEQACIAELTTTVVARVNFFGLHPTRPGGLLTWLLQAIDSPSTIGGFTDVEFNPLSTTDLAEWLEFAVRSDLAGGVYNFGSADACTKYDFAIRVAQAIGASPHRVQPAQLALQPRLAPRPLYTVMDTSRVRTALGRRLPTIDEGLRRTLESRAAVAA